MANSWEGVACRSFIDDGSILAILHDRLLLGRAHFHHGLLVLATDLGSRLASTSIVVMTEFGRRVQENSSLGTDHGRGSVMLVLGGGGGVRHKAIQMTLEADT